MNVNERFCQSCGMPMGQTDEMYGTEADGSKSLDYCKYCYEKGSLTFTGTMDEMIELCVPHMVGANADMSPDKARQMMKQFFPTLKRWKTGADVKLVQFEVIQLPRLRVWGKEIRVPMKDMMEGKNPVGGFWDACMADGTFETLQKLPGLYNSDYVGYMTGWQNTDTFVYVCGMLFTDTAAAALPAGFTSYEIEPTKVAVGWIQGKLVDTICSAEHALTTAAVKENGYDSEKALWSMEVYNDSRFTKPAKDGTIIVDYWLPAAPLDVL